MLREQDKRPMMRVRGRDVISRSAGPAIGS